MPIYTAVNFVSGGPMAMDYAKSPVEFGHDRIGSQQMLQWTCKRFVIVDIFERFKYRLT